MKITKRLTGALLLLAFAVALLPATLAADEPEAPAPYFESFTGVIEEIRPYYENDGTEAEGRFFVLVKNENGQEANLVITPDTLRLTEAELKKGATATGWYKGGMPMIMIYPPQYSIDILAVDLPQDGLATIKADRFDENLVSDDGGLKLIPGEETEILLDGEPYDGPLENRLLVVFYTVAAESLPARTTPEKIVVLSADEVKPEEETPPIPYPGDVSVMPIVVENQPIDAPAAYQTEDGVVMVPLRAICEALGYEVTWDADTYTAHIGDTMSVPIGKDAYALADAEPVALGAAAALKNSRTFVPLSFFTRVAGLNNAYVFEAQIVIDDGEKME